MRKVFAVALLVAAFVACDNPEAPTQLPNINIFNQNTNNNGGGGSGPGATPSPGTGACPIARNRVGFFGIRCPSGVNPRNGQGVLPMGCQGDATSTPKLADGSDATPAQHGPNITWDATTDRVRLVEVEEEFNRTVIPVAVGAAQVTATVQPLNCGPIVGLLNFDVVAGSSASIASDDLMDYYRDESRGDGPPVWRLMGKLRAGEPVPAAWRWEVESKEGPMPPYPPPASAQDHNPIPPGTPPTRQEGQEFPPK